ncbi:MAG: transcriptional regulator NrdR [Sphaerochaetaceae bacterium]|nr:transcriptional regulator NrdR [Sphaerochaetaceae bacterium]
MKCPNCSSDDDKVIDSRSNSAGTAVRRRRVCNACGYRFTSYETIERRHIVVHKKDGSYEDFNIDKVRRGIDSAAQKRNISPEQIDNLLNTLQVEIDNRVGADRIIESSAIGDEVLKLLYNIDRVAYVRFASVYKAFADVSQFVSEIQSLETTISGTK